MNAVAGTSGFSFPFVPAPYNCPRVGISLMVVAE
jgi:hypothetical protein